MKISFTDKITLEEIACIFLLQTVNLQDQPIFAYIAVDGSKLVEFKAAMAQPTFTPEKYGQILLTGIGTPSPEQMAAMEEDYGFDHQAMQPLPKPTS